jgi:hypothetical protein
MPESEMAWLHRCGTYYRSSGTEYCPGCQRPIMTNMPQSLIDASKDLEKATGLDRLRISLLGVVASAYTAGWEAALAAFDKHPEAPEVLPNGD